MLKYARGLLQPYEADHRRVVVMVDNAWIGSPGPKILRERLEEVLAQDWTEFAVIVIEPELEAWIMGENHHLARIFRCPENYREILANAGKWPTDAAKPPDPKAALEHLRRHHKARASSAGFGKLAAVMSVKHCQDAAFTQLREQLRAWFPEQP
jgi:hypothetical protein